MKILKKGGGSREKGGGGNEIHAPCACDRNNLCDTRCTLVGTSFRDVIGKECEKTPVTSL